MSTYTVKGGDTLSKIYSKLGYKSWQDLYQANKSVIGSNYNLIKPGQKLSYYSSSSSSSSNKVPSTEVGKTIASAVEDPTRQNFINKYGSEQDYYDENGNVIQGLRPDEMFQAVAEERVNPEQMRLASQAMKNLDWQRAIAGSGARASGSTLLARQNALNDLERQRKTAVNKYVQSQNELFNTWYNQEMNNYMTSKAPSAYQMNKFGIDTPWAGTQTTNTNQAYSYTPAVDITKLFKFGGYSRPAAMYNVPTPIS